MAVASLPKLEKPSRPWTYDEMVAELPETNLPVELWDGELITAPASFYFHQHIVFYLSHHLGAWVDNHNLGIVLSAPMDMVLTQHNVTQPDVLFISKARRHIIKNVIMGAVDLAMEVISTGSRSRDRIDKRDLYEQHGVKEYWIIDPDAETVEVFYLEGQQYQLLARSRPGDHAKSKLLEGFVVDVKEMFTAP
jgi:Uma2 family endonuclease